MPNDFKVMGPNCWHCEYFAISWQPVMPYICRLMGFKSKGLPCIEVLNADGRPCQGFLPKSRALEAKRLNVGKDLVNDKKWIA